MFPTKYDDFEGELLEQILHELKFQVAAVRRALIPAGGNSASNTAVEMPDERRRNSTKVDVGRLTSKSRFGGGLAPPSRNSRGSSTSADLPPLSGPAPEPSPQNVSMLAAPRTNSTSSELPPQNVSVPEPLSHDVSVESGGEILQKNVSATSIDVLVRVEE